VCGAPETTTGTSSLSFVVVSGNAEPETHRLVIKDTNGEQHDPEIAQLADEVLIGLLDWFRWLQGRTS
jgi:hypothetical protein